MLKKVIVELQSLGLRSRSQKGDRKGGAGPSEGRTLLIEGFPVMVPINSPHVLTSPYSLQKIEGKYYLLKDEKEMFPVDFIPESSFYDSLTQDRIPFKKIALLHGKDCLATTVLQRCTYWHTKNRCKFCGIELTLQENETLEKKTPEQLTEVVLAGQKSGLVKHVLLTTGTMTPPGREIAYLAACASLIKRATGLPIHVQFSPPFDPQQIQVLKSAGVDTVGIHIESFDFEILSHMAPAKAEIGLQQYTRAWDKSVEFFGKNQVSSFLIAGLGEKPETLIQGSRYLAERGVYPFLVPLRRIPGSLLNGVNPPPPALMMELYERVSEIIKKNGLSSRNNKAGCVRCCSCSAITLFDQ